VGIDFCESIRSELNRELGKIIERLTKKTVDEEKPEVTVILNLEKDRIDITARSLFIRGLYKKLVRGIPQTKWDMYKETVEDIIAAPLMIVTKGEAHAMHASGREDIDALCLDGRPFVIEIKNPQKRSVDLKALQKEVNGSGKVEISDLTFSEKEDVHEVKSARHDKSYRALVEFESPVKEEDLGKLRRLSCISQRTPTRVAHRRADLVRKRKVKDIKWKRINNKKFEFQIKGEAGLYIKELVSGDQGRTRPSISELLGNPATVKELDVIKVWKQSPAGSRDGRRRKAA
jgi:tRNA pseudouridine synthase 10